MVATVKEASNKRKNTRQECLVPVEGKRGSAFGQSRTTDISRGGAGLIVKSPIRVKTRMAIELNLTPESEPVLAIGEVKWVSKIANSEFYRIGISFTEVKTDSKSRLNRYFK